ncbi:hypothetical protein P152DRAFT_484052 [Eremomyces bilateralis CBS 781.70]|uniref:Protein-lysine N-methyltransferase EFM6 n=1 Tax=Eremomyces bilateralis CBS 781.70 TaxID=1392243 RepID=A0A6G1FXA1_9PEZI|nr:uncharacterized protein P152DRAFT_484052 [Eremomyces bilateralis CBS 781.70]KAF1810249.1 hypothetical protein P152DRAFT_484052 [Eremomyces bilateralis CBS 781.70]
MARNGDEAMENNDVPLPFGFSEDLVPIRDNKAPGISKVDFDGRLEAPLQLYEDLSGGCGGQMWPAGMVLAEYILDHKQLVEGCSILELGAGGGLTGLAVATGCPTSGPLYITDQAVMLPIMQKNIELNGLSLVTAVEYNWGAPAPAPSLLPPHLDVVLAADCVYFEPAFPLLQATLQDLIGAKTRCYFCFKKRRRADIACIKRIRKMFDVRDIPVDSEGVAERDNIFLMEITKKS